MSDTTTSPNVIMTTSYTAGATVSNAGHGTSYPYTATTIHSLNSTDNQQTSHSLTEQTTLNETLLTKDHTTEPTTTITVAEVSTNVDEMETTSRITTGRPDQISKNDIKHI